MHYPAPHPHNMNTHHHHTKMTPSHDTPLAHHLLNTYIISHQDDHTPRTRAPPSCSSVVPSPPPHHTSYQCCSNRISSDTTCLAPHCPRWIICTHVHHRMIQPARPTPPQDDHHAPHHTAHSHIHHTPSALIFLPSSSLMLLGRIPASSRSFPHARHLRAAYTKKITYTRLLPPSSASNDAASHSILVQRDKKK